MITAAQLAAQLGCTERTIRRHARKLGIAKLAGVFVFSDEDAERIKQSIAATKPTDAEAHRVTVWRRKRRQANETQH